MLSRWFGCIYGKSNHDLCPKLGLGQIIAGQEEAKNQKREKITYGLQTIFRKSDYFQKKEKCYDAFQDEAKNMHTYF